VIIDQTTENAQNTRMLIHILSRICHCTKQRDRPSAPREVESGEMVSPSSAD